jgi:hypothetical protein
MVSLAATAARCAVYLELTRSVREHPEASEVFVTGTFDDWGQTEKLEKKGDFFEKDVQLPNKDKILYKVRRTSISDQACTLLSPSRSFA